jgi:hypothetical protein
LRGAHRGEGILACWGICSRVLSSSSSSSHALAALIIIPIKRAPSPSSLPTPLKGLLLHKHTYTHTHKQSDPFSSLHIQAKEEEEEERSLLKKKTTLPPKNTEREPKWLPRSRSPWASRASAPSASSSMPSKRESCSLCGLLPLRSRNAFWKAKAKAKANAAAALPPCAHTRLFGLRHGAEHIGQLGASLSHPCSLPAPPLPPPPSPRERASVDELMIARL